MKTPIDKILSRAKIGMLQKKDTVFLSTICFSLEFVLTDTVPTAATDGKKMLINPEFFERLTIDERVFVLAHETLHVAYLHMLRVEGRDFKRWNKACDYVINRFLQQRGFMLVQDVLVDRKFDGMTSEQVYELLDDDPDDSFIPDLQCPEGAPPPDLSKEITDIVVRASLRSQMAGEGGGAIPVEIQRMLEDLLKPKVDWRRVLARFFKSLSKSDYSFKKFNRKYLPDGLYFPTLQSEGNLSRVDFAVDVSGSVTNKICTQFCSEVYSVLKNYSPNEIGVMQFDHRVQKTTVVKGFKDLLTMKFVGGGGTLISPVFEAFKKSPAQALIILTDGYIWQRDHFKKPDNRPVIWCIYNNPNFTAPFGKVIHFNLA